MAKDLCIMCGKETAYDFETHIDLRIGYIEGAGQLCHYCYTNQERKVLYPEDYVTKTMKNRTTLITISGEDILNTPNDFELGEKVRRLYYEQKDNS